MEQEFSTYYEDEDVVVRLERTGGYVFVHTDVSGTLNKDLLGRIRSGFSELLSELKDEGHEWAFATSDDKKSTKFWNLVHKCDTVNKFGPNQEYWIGAWYFGDD